MDFTKNVISITTLTKTYTVGVVTMKSATYVLHVNCNTNHLQQLSKCHSLQCRTLYFNFNLFAKPKSVNRLSFTLYQAVGISAFLTLPRHHKAHEHRYTCFYCLYHRHSRQYRRNGGLVAQTRLGRLEGEPRRKRDGLYHRWLNFGVYCDNQRGDVVWRRHWGAKLSRI